MFYLWKVEILKLESSIISCENWNEVITFLRESQSNIDSITAYIEPDGVLVKDEEKSKYSISLEVDYR